FIQEQVGKSDALLAEARLAINSQDWEAARAKLKAAAEISPNDDHVKEGLALLPQPVESWESTGVAPVEVETPHPAGVVPLISQTGPEIRPPKPGIFARIVQSPRFWPTVLLGFVFVVNWFETALEAIVPGWRSWNGVRSMFSAF